MRRGGRSSSFARGLGASVAALVLTVLLAAPAAAGSVPPPAPQPTSTAASPDAPDPHPPAGGRGPSGQAVGGTALQSRGLVTPAGAPALPTGLTASAWALVDLDSGNVLAAQDPHGRYQPASILKILTVDTLLPKLPGNRVVTVSAAAANTEGSRAGLIAGGSYTVDQLFSGLLLVSGNDTATALAEAAGGVSQTVAAMNAKALALGAYDTFVQTPSGLDGWQQLTSAYDMAIFLRTAVNSQRFVDYDQQPTVTLPEQHVNGNGFGAVKLVNQGEPFLTEVPGGFFSKIGFTDAAQDTYLAATNRNGRRLGVVFLRAERWPLDQWQQAAKLFDWGYALPATTPAVGHLDAAYPTPKASPSHASSPAKAAAAAANGGGPTRLTAGRLGLAVAATLAVVALIAGLSSLAATVRQRLRPANRRRSTSRPRSRAGTAKPTRSR
jgi:serine-type D-Ala-D-Ala carboxypeptidase (penicillin-binding protein 5/6)